jgi:hypothetical protein
LGYLPEGAVEEIPARILREQLGRNEKAPRVPQPLSPSPAMVVRKRAERRVDETPREERFDEPRTGGMNWEEKKKAMAKAAAARGSAARAGAKAGGKPSAGKPSAGKPAGAGRPSGGKPAGGKPGPRRPSGRDR